MADTNSSYSSNGEISGILNLPRFVNLIKRAIQKLELNLDGLVVLTEAASGNYVCTPIIAALGGSEKVYAYARDSKYGKAKDIIANTEKLARIVGVWEKIEFVELLEDEMISESDIVTNLGSLRPITKEFISKMKDTAVIPLMRETWEFRMGEINLSSCQKNEVVVLGTNENHPDLLIFDYLGHLCAKKLFDLNIEILNSKILLVGGGDFGLNIAKYLVKLGAKVLIICEEDTTITESIGSEKISDLSRPSFSNSELSGLDSVVVTSYPDKTEIISDNGLIEPFKLKMESPGVSIIQFKGNLNRNDILKAKIPILPEQPSLPNHMSWTLNDLGPKPVIDLHAAGLKVGEISSRYRLSGESYNSTINLASKNSLVDNFSSKQRKELFLS